MKPKMQYKGTSSSSSSSSSCVRIVFASKNHERLGRLGGIGRFAGHSSTCHRLGGVPTTKHNERTTRLARFVSRRDVFRTSFVAVAVPPRLTQLEPMPFFRLVHLWRFIVRNRADYLRELRMSAV